MKRNFYPGWMLATALLLTACHRTPSYTELMTHPQLLEKEVKRCQDNAHPEMVAYCQTVNNAANDFTNYENERMASPEGFGMQIMLEETRWIRAKQDLEAAKKEGDKEKIAEAQKVLNNQVKTVHILWAVVALAGID